MVQRCAALLLAALPLVGCSSSYEYDHRLAQARAEHIDGREASPPPVRHARRIRHGPRVHSAERRDERQRATPVSTTGLATGTVSQRADGGGPQAIRTSTEINAYLRDRMRRPSPVVDSPEWKIEKAADARRERQIDHTIHSICNGC
jgi:hypothetical protein